MLVKEYASAFLHFLFPHLCPGCGTDLPDDNMLLCLRCLHDLPYTAFENLPGNPVEKVFWGRIEVCEAASAFYYTRGSVMQRLIKNIKYKGAQKLCDALGNLMAKKIAASGRFQDLDCVVPLPLHRNRMRQRGYNQAEILSKSIARELHLPVCTNMVVRNSETSTQTRKGRTERWQNMQGRFEILSNSSCGQSVLLVDDVLTTGATLEACGASLLQIPGLRLSVATLCFAAGS